jgi:hypothetical protein
MMKAIKILIVSIPALLSIAWMVLILFKMDIYEFDPFNTMPVISLLVCVLLFTLLNFLVPAKRRDFLELAVLTPCFIAPLAVSGLWSLAPGTLGIGIGGFEYFLHWLTKYPNFGPLNLEVLMGALCILGTFFLPALFSLYSVVAKRPRLTYLFLFILADLVVYAAVFFRLDRYSWKAIYDQLSNPNVLFLISGPMFRFLPVLFMPAFAFFSYFLKNREPEEPQ